MPESTRLDLQALTQNNFQEVFISNDTKSRSLLIQIPQRKCYENKFILKKLEGNMD